jgi:hypothetical protein
MSWKEPSVQQKIVISTLKEIRALRKTILLTADRSVKVLMGLAKSRKGFHLLSAMKFDQIGCDPLDEECPWNFIEQLNQTFTYLVTLQGAAHLIRRHPEAAPFTLNLGTLSGPDICSADKTIVAEVFAVTSPSSNQKLKKDTQKVLQMNGKLKFVFYFSRKAPVRARKVPGVQIVRLRRL